MMKEYKVYTKGIEEGCLSAAYLVADDEGNVVAKGSKKFSYVIDGVSIERNKGHFVMEILAAWSGLSKIPVGSKVTIISNDKVTLRKIEMLDDVMPYSHFISWIDNVVKSKMLSVAFEWVKRNTDASKIIDEVVQPMALKIQKQ